MKAILVLVLLWPLSAAWARSQGPWQKSLVPISPDRSLYVEYRPAAPGQPTVVLLNGLTYTTQQWAPFVQTLEQVAPDIGIVLYDMQGMGQTLLNRLPVNYDVTIPDQIHDLKALMTVMNIPGPKILAGLSYGGAVTLGYAAQYADDFQSYVAMAPYLERLAGQDQTIENLIKWHRLSFPFDPRSHDELYDFYLHQVVYSTYPALEPNVLASPFYLEGVYRLAKGAENWVTADIASRLPVGKIHLMGGALDPYVAKADLNQFWNVIPPKARASFVMLDNTTHEVPNIEPRFTAEWLMRIIHQDPALEHGQKFEANPITGTIRTEDSAKVSTQRGFSCEALLQKIFQPR